MIDLVRLMVERIGVPVHEAVRMATETPARAMGWKTKGQLLVGADAELVFPHARARSRASLDRYICDRNGSASHSVVRSQSERFLKSCSVYSFEFARSFWKIASIRCANS